jgi:hypothetical protein
VELHDDVQQTLEALGYDPVEGMAKIAMDETVEVSIRAQMYNELAQYVVPKCRAVEMQAEVGYSWIDAIRESYKREYQPSLVQIKADAKGLSDPSSWSAVASAGAWGTGHAPELPAGGISRHARGNGGSSLPRWSLPITIQVYQPPDAGDTIFVDDEEQVISRRRNCRESWRLDLQFAIALLLEP